LTFSIRYEEVLKKIAKEISIGPKVYFASQVVAVLNNELDRRGV